MARNKKNGTDLYLVCSFTFKLPAVASKFFLRYRGGIFLQFPVTSGRRKNSKIFRALPGIQYIFALHHVNKSGKFQRGIINPHLFTFICSVVFSAVQHSRKIALNSPLIFVVLRCSLHRHLEFLRVNRCS